MTRSCCGFVVFSAIFNCLFKITRSRVNCTKNTTAAWTRPWSCVNLMGSLFSDLKIIEKVVLKKLGFDVVPYPI